MTRGLHRRRRREERGGEDRGGGEVVGERKGRWSEG